MVAGSKRTPLRKRLRNWGCLTALIVVVAVAAIIVLLALIARDPTGAAGGVSYFWGHLGDAARAILRAPLNFFHALLTFVEDLFH